MCIGWPTHTVQAPHATGQRSLEHAMPGCSDIDLQRPIAPGSGFGEEQHGVRDTEDGTTMMIGYRGFLDARRARRKLSTRRATHDTTDTRRTTLRDRSTIPTVGPARDHATSHTRTDPSRIRDRRGRQADAEPLSRRRHRDRHRLQTAGGPQSPPAHGAASAHAVAAGARPRAPAGADGGRRARRR